MIGTAQERRPTTTEVPEIVRNFQHYFGQGLAVDEFPSLDNEDTQRIQASINFEHSLNVEFEDTCDELGIQAGEILDVITTAIFAHTNWSVTFGGMAHTHMETDSTEDEEEHQETKENLKKNLQTFVQTAQKGVRCCLAWMAAAKSLNRKDTFRRRNGLKTLEKPSLHDSQKYHAEKLLIQTVALLERMPLYGTKDQDLIQLVEESKSKFDV